MVYALFHRDMNERWKKEGHEDVRRTRKSGTTSAVAMQTSAAAAGPNQIICSSFGVMRDEKEKREERKSTHGAFDEVLTLGKRRIAAIVAWA